MEVGEDGEGTQTVKSTSERLVFLFSDIIIWAKEKKNIFKVEGAVLLTNTRIVDVSGYNEILQNSFEIHAVDGVVCTDSNQISAIGMNHPSSSSSSSSDGVVSSVCVSAKSVSVKREWVQLIKKLNRDLRMAQMKTTPQFCFLFLE